MQRLLTMFWQPVTSAWRRSDGDALKAPRQRLSNGGPAVSYPERDRSPPFILFIYLLNSSKITNNTVLIQIQCNAILPMLRSNVMSNKYLKNIIDI